MPYQPLHNQTLPFSSPQTKTRLAILSLAIVDALGAPAEFLTRFRFPVISSMLKNKTFGTGPGTWTDDTSMTLCLARSITKCKGINETDQLNAYLRWFKDGYLSAIGYCFDIGTNVRRALGIYSKAESPKKGLEVIQQELAGELCGGNGSLMRILPVGLAYWQGDNDEEWKENARRCSLTTHPNRVCIEACQVWTGAIVKIMRANAKKDRLTKLDLLEYFSSFPYTHFIFDESVCLPSPLPDTDDEHLRENHFLALHPILELVNAVRHSTPSKTNPLNLPTAKQLPSSGYVIDTLVAALYCFFASTTFEEGAMLAVNMGNDADTVGAVYGGLAGCWYGATEEEDKERGLYWGERLKQWKNDLVETELIEKVTNDFIKFVY